MIWDPVIIALSRSTLYENCLLFWWVPHLISISLHFRFKCYHRFLCYANNSTAAAKDFSNTICIVCFLYDSNAAVDSCFQGFFSNHFHPSQIRVNSTESLCGFFGPRWFGCGDDLHLDSVLMKLHTKRLGVIEPLVFKRKKEYDVQGGNYVNVPLKCVQQPFNIQSTKFVFLSTFLGSSWCLLWSALKEENVTWTLKKEKSLCTILTLQTGFTFSQCITIYKTTVLNNHQPYSHTAPLYPACHVLRSLRSAVQVLRLLFCFCCGRDSASKPWHQWKFL